MIEVITSKSATVKTVGTGTYQRRAPLTPEELAAHRARGEAQRKVSGTGASAIDAHTTDAELGARAHNLAYATAAPEILCLEICRLQRRVAVAEYNLEMWRGSAAEFAGRLQKLESSVAPKNSPHIKLERRA